MLNPRPAPAAFYQHGATVLVMLLIMLSGIATLLVSTLNSSALKLTRQQNTATALAQAKEVLIGDSISASPIAMAGYLRLPDMGFGIGNVASEGSAAPNFSGNNIDYSLLGKLPWKTLGTPALRDGQGECIWYAVSGHFKKNPISNIPLNWDTTGQIDLLDGSGNAIAVNLAALLIAPGAALDGQNRSLANAAYSQCKGNYDAQNYLDPYLASDALSGTRNYFSGSLNQRIAVNTGNKQFIITNNAHYNDQFLTVSTDDLFRPLVRRGEFAAQITALMNDPYFQHAPISGNKGTSSINCANLIATNQTFCSNWQEMLLLTQLPSPTSMLIDGTPSPLCSRILFFAGTRTTSQLRASASDKMTPANYLSGSNLTLFATPLAHTGVFTGNSAFDAKNPSAVLLRCIT